MSATLGKKVLLNLTSVGQILNLGDILPKSSVLLEGYNPAVAGVEALMIKRLPTVKSEKHVGKSETAQSSFLQMERSGAEEEMKANELISEIQKLDDAADLEKLKEKEVKELEALLKKLQIINDIRYLHEELRKKEEINIDNISLEWTVQSLENLQDEILRIGDEADKEAELASRVVGAGWTSAFAGIGLKSRPSGWIEALRKELRGLFVQENSQQLSLIEGIIWTTSRGPRKERLIEDIMNFVGVNSATDEERSCELFSKLKAAVAEAASETVKKVPRPGDIKKIGLRTPEEWRSMWEKEKAGIVDPQRQRNGRDPTKVFEWFMKVDVTAWETGGSHEEHSANFESVWQLLANTVINYVQEKKPLEDKQQEKPAAYGSSTNKIGEVLAELHNDYMKSNKHGIRHRRWAEAIDLLRDAKCGQYTTDTPINEIKTAVMNGTCEVVGRFDELEKIKTLDPKTLVIQVYGGVLTSQDQSKISLTPVFAGKSRYTSVITHTIIPNKLAPTSPGEKLEWLVPAEKLPEKFIDAKSFDSLDAADPKNYIREAQNAVPKEQLQNFPSFGDIKFSKICPSSEIWDNVTLVVSAHGDRNEIMFGYEPVSPIKVVDRVRKVHKACFPNKEQRGKLLLVIDSCYGFDFLEQVTNLLNMNEGIPDHVHFMSMSAAHKGAMCKFSRRHPSDSRTERPVEVILDDATFFWNGFAISRDSERVFSRDQMYGDDWNDADFRKFFDAANRRACDASKKSCEKRGCELNPSCHEISKELLRDWFAPGDTTNKRMEVVKFLKTLEAI